MPDYAPHGIFAILALLSYALIFGGALAFGRHLGQAIAGRLFRT